MEISTNQPLIKFSIIVPVYNAEKYLERCLKSLFMQDMDSEEYEVIAINDGSEDASESILQQLAQFHSNLKWITTPNRGVSEARNLGCGMARGRYLLFVDSDDYVAPNVFLEVYEQLEKEQLDILVMDYTFWDEHDRQHLFSELDKRYTGCTEVMDGKLFMQRCLPQVVWCSAYRTEFWRQHHLSYLPIRHEDEEILPRIFYYAKRVMFHPVMLYYYFRNPDSFMMNYDVKACHHLISAMKSVDRFRQQHVKEPTLNVYFQNLIASRLLSTVVHGVRCGLSHKELLGVVHELKKSKLAPLPQGKNAMHKVLYKYLPACYVAYYRMKKKRR